MDVDLLRPGTVPISPDTKLWFEFLVNPSVLPRHLNHPTADPTPTALLAKFISLSSGSGKLLDGGGLPGVESNGVCPVGPNKLNRRSQALKILALQVAAHLCWDLDLFETKIPLSVQGALLKDLLCTVDHNMENVNTHTDLKFSEMKPHALFVVFLYHRWVLKSFISCKSSPKNKINGVQQESLESVSEKASERSLEVLRQMTQCDLKQGLSMPTLDCFTPLTEEFGDVIHKWSNGIPISQNQFQCQAFMDMAKYIMLRENYSEAKATLSRCQDAYRAWKSEKTVELFSYCSVTDDIILEYSIAVGITPRLYTPSLIQQFHSLVAQQYLNMDKVLERDNLLKEIPLMYRDALEADLSSEVAAGRITVYRDGLVEIQASNVVRRALEGRAWQMVKVTPSALNKVLAPLIPRCSTAELKRLKYLVGDTLVNGDLQTCREMVELPTTKRLLSEDEIASTVESDYTDPIPQVLCGSSDFIDSEILPSVKSPRLEIASIERVLTTSYDPHDLKEALTKLIALVPSFNMTKSNKKWDLIPSPFHNIIKNNLPGPILHHYCFILLAKAYELDEMKNFGQARVLLKSVMSEVTQERGNSQFVTKLNQLVSWELLLFDIHQFHAEWPDKHIDWSGLSQKCIAVLNKTDGVVPRLLLKEECALALLNSGQWAALIGAPLNKHTSVTLDLYPSLAVACEDVNKYNKKISNDVWEKLVSIFINNQKRRESTSGISEALCSIVELNALAIVISMLAKLHNIVADQSHLELFTHLNQLWPNAVKNSNQYSSKVISEILMEVLEHSLKHYPNHVPWLKLMGDLHFVNGHYTSALKSYLEAAIAGTDYFSRPLLKNIIEDHIYKRMIKCCANLQCHTQAGILCQFLEEIDYTTAFKSFSETSFSDAMDSYYDCIWDVNILEYLINLHTKRSEHHRRQKAIHIMGLLELNSNNNEEIKREAENIRKGRFMRAMVAQYLT